MRLFLTFILEAFNSFRYIQVELLLPNHIVESGTLENISNRPFYARNNQLYVSLFIILNKLFNSVKSSCIYFINSNCIDDDLLQVLPAGNCQLLKFTSCI